MIMSIITPLNCMYLKIYALYIDELCNFQVLSMFLEWYSEKEMTYERNGGMLITL